MTDPEQPARDASSETLNQEVEHLEDDAEAMERYDRAIPLPHEDGEEDEGVGEITGLVP